MKALWLHSSFCEKKKKSSGMGFPGKLWESSVIPLLPPNSGYCSHLNSAG
jgi:hypothetical protein